MKAVRVERLCDDLDSVNLAEIATPEPARGQVLVRMGMAPIHPSDFNRIHGTYHRALETVIWNQGDSRLAFDPDGETPCPMPPYTLGGEGMGVVEATGGGFLANRLMGKRVCLLTGGLGSWAEYAVADARRCVPVPPGMGSEQGATMLLNPLSAMVMTTEELQIPKGGWLLQTAAGSALGKIVCRLGRIHGFRTINVVRTGENVDAIRAAGGDELIITEHDDVIERVYQITRGRGVGHAMDCVGGELTEIIIRCLGRGGRLVVYGTLSASPATLPTRSLMMPVTSITGFFLPNWAAQQSPLKMLSIIGRVKKYAAQGVFDGAVAGTFPLDNVADALVAARARGRKGKILLKVGP